MNNGFCLLCKIRIPNWKRSDSRFCSDECRKRYFDMYKRNLLYNTPNKEVVGVGYGEY